MFDIIERAYSDDKQTRNVIDKLYGWMDIQKEAQEEFRKQGALNGRR